MVISRSVKGLGRCVIRTWRSGEERLLVAHVSRGPSCLTGHVASASHGHIRESSPAEVLRRLFRIQPERHSCKRHPKQQRSRAMGSLAKQHRRSWRGPASAANPHFPATSAAPTSTSRHAARPLGPQAPPSQPPPHLLLGLQQTDLAGWASMQSRRRRRPPPACWLLPPPLPPPWQAIHLDGRFISAAVKRPPACMAVRSTI